MIGVFFATTSSPSSPAVAKHLSDEVIEARIVWRVAQLRVLAAETAVKYWRDPDAKKWNLVNERD